MANMKSYSAYFIRTEDLDIAKAKFNKIEPVIDPSWVMCDFAQMTSLQKRNFEILVGCVSDSATHHILHNGA
jgi:hypothetical protein